MFKFINPSLLVLAATTLFVPALPSQAQSAPRAIAEKIDCNQGGILISQTRTRPVSPVSPEPITIKRPTTPTNTGTIAAPDGATEGKQCDEMTAPATNEQGVDGTNKCTSCSYDNGGFTVNCVFTPHSGSGGN